DARDARLAQADAAGVVGDARQHVLADDVFAERADDGDVAAETAVDRLRADRSDRHDFSLKKTRTTNNTNIMNEDKRRKAKRDAVAAVCLRSLFVLFVVTRLQIAEESPGAGRAARAGGSGRAASSPGTVACRRRGLPARPPRFPAAPRRAAPPPSACGRRRRTRTPPADARNPA